MEYEEHEPLLADSDARTSPLRIGSLTAVAGDPESSESPDPDSEDYFASGEGSIHSTSSYSDSISDATIRADSAASQWPFHRNATPRPPHSSMAIHPALREQPIFFFEGDSVLPSHVPMRSVNAFPPSPAKQQEPQVKRKLSTIFRFGDYGTPALRESSSRQQIKQQAQSLKRRLDRLKIDDIRNALGDLNISDRIRQVVGTKRSHRDTDADNINNQPAHKAPKTNIHCQTCQCRKVVQESLSRYHNLNHGQTPSMPPRTERHLTPYPWMNSDIVTDPAEDYSNDRTPPHQNGEALTMLEGTSPPPQHQAPAALARRNPHAVFSASEVGFLQTLLHDAERTS